MHAYEHGKVIEDSSADSTETSTVPLPDVLASGGRKTPAQLIHSSQYFYTIMQRCVCLTFDCPAVCDQWVWLRVEVNKIL